MSETPIHDNLVWERIVEQEGPLVVIDPIIDEDGDQ